MMFTMSLSDRDKIMENFTPLIHEFLDEVISKESWYQNIKDELKAIVLYGSVAKGNNQSDSDIDLLFILPLEIEEKYTSGEYVLSYGGQEFNIVMRSIEKLRQLTGGPHDVFQAEVFRESKIIWQKDEEVKKLIKIIQQK